MKRIVIALSLMMAYEVAHAKPLYLECEFTNKVGFSVKLDEDTGGVTHTYSSNSAFNAEGLFSPNEISYSDVSFLGRSKNTDRFQINRTTLAVTNEMLIDSDVVITRNGSCKVISIANRKI